MTTEVEQALKSGDWSRAATLHREAGRFLDAAQLFERLLDFESAAACYAASGRPAHALTCALRSRLRPLESSTLAQLQQSSTQQELHECARVAADLSRPDVAAPLFDLAGDADSAAHEYEAAGQLAVAARRFLSVGDHRRAGQLLEQHLATSPSDPHALLELGGVLAGFGRHDEAAPLFRRAAAHRVVAEASLRRLAVCLWEMGHPFAAEKVLEELRLISPAAPRDLLALAALEESASVRDDKAGRRVRNRYVLLRPRSASSLGDVYLAHDELEGRDVVLTMFRPGVAQSQALRRLAGTAHAAAALELPQILPLVEFNLDHGFMVTAVPRGPSLDEWLQTGILRGVDAVLRTLGRALATLHRRALVHGALNLGNVHLSDAGEVEIAEVGAGLLLGLRETESQGLQSSLATLAPEAMAGAEPTAAADQFAVAALAYHFATGRWGQPSGTSGWRPPSHHVVAAGPLDDALGRALAPVPHHRFEHMLAFLDALPALPQRTVPPAPRSPSPQRYDDEVRFVPTGISERADNLEWSIADDTFLARKVAVGKGGEGAFAAAATLARIDAGIERVLDMEADASGCTIVVADGPAPESVEGRLEALVRCSAALMSIHDAGLTLGASRGLRMAAPLVLRLAGLPLPSTGSPRDIEQDLEWLWARAVELGGLGAARPSDAARMRKALAERCEEVRGQRRQQEATSRGASGSADAELNALRRAMGLETGDPGAHI